VGIFIIPFQKRGESGFVFRGLKCTGAVRPPPQRTYTHKCRWQHRDRNPTPTHTSGSQVLPSNLPFLSRSSLPSLSSPLPPLSPPPHLVALSLRGTTFWTIQALGDKVSSFISHKRALFSSFATETKVTAQFDKRALFVLFPKSRLFNLLWRRATEARVLLECCCSAAAVLLRCAAGMVSDDRIIPQQG